jgi:hypothetical protein
VRKGERASGQGFKQREERHFKMFSQHLSHHDPQLGKTLFAQHCISK